MLCDDWPGIDDCFEPEKEIVVVKDAEGVVNALRRYDDTARKGLDRHSTRGHCGTTRMLSGRRRRRLRLPSRWQSARLWPGEMIGAHMNIVIYGLTITSSWGNGHATTYRSLAKALKRRGHTVQFIEKDVEWYRSNRDLPQPEFCAVQLYSDWNGRQMSGAGQR